MSAESIIRNDLWRYYTHVCICVCLVHNCICVYHRWFDVQLKRVHILPQNAITCLNIPASHIAKYLWSSLRELYLYLIIPHTIVIAAGYLLKLVITFGHVLHHNIYPGLPLTIVVASSYLSHSRYYFWSSLRSCNAKDPSLNGHEYIGTGRRSKFAVFHRQWWNLHMTEKCGKKKMKQTNK